MRFRLRTYQLVHRILHPSGGVGVEHSLWLRHLCEDLEIKLSTDYELGFLEKEQRTRERRDELVRHLHVCYRRFRATLRFRL